MSGSLRSVRILLLALVLLLALAVVVGTIERPQHDQIAPDLARLYEGAGTPGAWVDANGRPTILAGQALRQLSKAGDDGLDAADYEIDDLGRRAEALRQVDTISNAEAAAFDVQLTDALLKYFRHLHLGRVDPRDLGFELDHVLEPHDFPARLRLVVAEGSFSGTVAALRPPFVQYRRLREALPEYRRKDPRRARQIELALERLRWVPDFAGKRLVVVNIPMFHVWAWNVDRGDGRSGH